MEDYQALNRELLTFLDASPNSFYAIKNMAELLATQGYRRLYEGDAWTLEAGRDYFVTRNDSSLIAFRIPKRDYAGFQIMASHSDSPTFKIKTNAEISVENRYVKLNVEKYGGMICSTWFDRPLSVAGRIIVRTPEGIATKLVNVDRDLLVIPSLAIHMDRTVNDGYKFNVQKDLLPLLSGESAEHALLNAVAAEAGVQPEEVLDTDLFLYQRVKGAVTGLHGEFLSAGRLDDLQCAFASLKGVIEASPGDSVAVLCVFDNEEVGSATKQGAASTFLRDVLHRINDIAGRGEDGFIRSLAGSFMVSADNAHAAHPNYGDKADPTNRPALNGGIVIKYSANQRYTTDAVSGAVFRMICEKAGVPYQTFVNRSDMLGGSTLGNISNTQVAVNTVDIGLPQLAMHSAWETAGARDTAYLVEAAKVLFSTSVTGIGDGSYKIG